MFDIASEKIRAKVHQTKVNIHLMYAPEGKSYFCFPESPDEVEGNIRTRGKTSD